jgi:hypothetical protein
VSGVSPPDGDLSERRQVENERAFKRLNAKIEEHVRQMQGGQEAAEEVPGFLCECADMRCRERLAIEVDEYADAHREPGRYCVRPGHERPDLERVLARRPGYVVVEKHVEAA